MDLEIGLCEKDKGHLEKFLNSISSNVPIKNKKVKLNGNIYESVRIIICCKKMCNDLILLGCTPKKSLILKFPNEEIVPKNLIKDFIRGYFDGDGCVHKVKSQNSIKIILVGTMDLLNGIKNIFFNNKILRTEPVIQQKGNAYQMTINGNDNIIDIYNYLYENSTIYLDRKYNKFNEYIYFIKANRQNNVSQKRGVYFDKRIKKWIATIYINKKRILLGNFINLEDAIKIRKEYEIKKMIAEKK